MNRRAVTPVLGLVLLLGITAVASLAIFVAGTTLAESTQSTAETQQAERSMAQLADSGNRIAAGESQRAGFSIQGASSGQVIADGDAGRINITVTNRSTGNRLLEFEKNLGAVIYESGDGTQIAYQGGGVWRRDGSGEGQLVRSPEFHYRENPDPTITFPVQLVRDNFTAQGQMTGDLVATQSERFYPTRPVHTNPLQQGSVEITIQSEYCEGWEEYYSQRTDGTPSEDCDDGTEDELIIQFSVPFELNSLDNGVMLGGSYSDTQLEEDFDIDADDVTTDADPPSVTPVVEAKLDEAKDSGRVLPDDDTIDDPGLYYDDGNLSDGDDLTFDTSSGDIVIATEQSPAFNTEDYDIVGDNNVTVYTTGDLVDNGGGDGEIGTPGKADQLRVFFHSDVDTIGDTGQNTDFHGLIYAPNSDVELFRGSNNASGAIVAEDYDFGNTEMDIDPELADVSFYEEIGDAPFYYLHISETTLHVERD